MNYELAKKLKDAGFPESEEDNKYIEPDNTIVSPGSGPCTEKAIYVPSLSELIEACGYEFRMLLLHTTYNKKLKKPWEAVPNKKIRPEVKGAKGSTPEEAVANLWLYINTNKKL